MERPIKVFTLKTICKTSKPMVNCGSSKDLCDRDHQLLLKKKEKCTVSCVKMLKFVDSVGSHYLVQILRTLIFVSKSKNVWKADADKNFAMESTNFFGKEGRGYQVSCAKYQYLADILEK